MGEHPIGRSGSTELLNCAVPIECAFFVRTPVKFIGVDASLRGRSAFWWLQRG